MSVRLRQILAALAGLGGAAVFATFIYVEQTVKKQAYIPVIALAVAAVAAQLRPLGAQLLARGLWWSNLVLGVLLCVTGNGREVGIGAALAAGCGAALVVADRRALAEASEGAGYRPVAYAGTLQLLMVLALADAQTLGLFALIFYPEGQGAPLALGALGLLAGFVGLYRLSLAGVAATMATSLGVLLALATRAMRIDRDLVAPLMALSAVQLAVPLPMLASMALRRPLPAPPARLRGRLADAVVVALVVGAVAWGYFRRMR
ncbi:MAG: hypothetical protein U0324_45605 [Polyangiales bacterium]